MPQESLFSDRPTTGLVLQVDDLTLLALSDATEVTARAVDIKGDTRYVASVVLVGVQQDLLETLLSRALVAHRYGTDADVRIAFRKTLVEARRHSEAHAKR